MLQWHEFPTQIKSTVNNSISIDVRFSLQSWSNRLLYWYFLLSSNVATLNRDSKTKTLRRTHSGDKVCLYLQIMSHWMLAASLQLLLSAALSLCIKTKTKCLGHKIRTQRNDHNLRWVPITSHVWRRRKKSTPTYRNREAGKHNLLWSLSPVLRMKDKGKWRGGAHAVSCGG